MIDLFGNMRSKIVGAVAAAAMGLVATVASATTVSFDQYLTGTNLGSSSLASLTAVQNGSNVDLTFTNTGIAAGASSFDTQLFLQYNGSVAGISLGSVTGVAISGFQKAVSNVFGPWDMLISWSSSNRNNGASRLNIGEYTSFSLLNANLANLFLGSGSTPFAMIHVQGLTDGSSTKYGGSVTTPPAPVPLPAAGILLIAAIGGLGAMSRRKAT